MISKNGTGFSGIMIEEQAQHGNDCIKFSKLMSALDVGAGVSFAGFGLYALMLRQGIRVPF